MPLKPIRKHYDPKRVMNLIELNKKNSGSYYIRKGNVVEEYAARDLPIEDRFFLKSGDFAKRISNLSKNINANTKKQDALYNKRMLALLDFFPKGRLTYFLRKWISFAEAKNKTPTDITQKEFYLFLKKHIHNEVQIDLFLRRLGNYLERSKNMIDLIKRTSKSKIRSRKVIEWLDRDAYNELNRLNMYLTIFKNAMEGEIKGEKLIK